MYVNYWILFFSSHVGVPGKSAGVIFTPVKTEIVSFAPELVGGWYKQKSSILLQLYTMGMVILRVPFNQAYGWCTPNFYKSILSAKCVCVFVCVSVLGASNNSGMIWIPYDWLNKFYSFCMLSIVSRHGLTIEALHRKQPNKSELALYKPLLHFYNHLKQLYISNKT